MVGQAADAGGALAAAERLLQVVLLDVQRPELDGLRGRGAVERGEKPASRNVGRISSREAVAMVHGCKTRMHGGSSRSQSSRAKRRRCFLQPATVRVVLRCCEEEGAAIGIGAEWLSFGWSYRGGWLPDLAVGWTLIACGCSGWSIWLRAAAEHLRSRPDCPSGFAASFTTTGLAAIEA